ncbi:MAG TPA: hypothetical protein VGG39_30875 [Polyangiaceae bacterium]|jgi:hypothetical protein
MRAPSLLAAAVLVLASSTLVASGLLGCGGAFAPRDANGDAGDDAGGHDAGPTGDASPDPDGGGGDASNDASPAPWSSVCPASLPAIGSACSLENVECEYGSAWWSISCDAVVQCSAGAWTKEQPSYTPCSAQPGPNAPSCPATYASVPTGTSCDATGLRCVYGQGLCTCDVPLGGPILIDGGTGSWGCVPENGCPFPRPRLGSPCDGSSATSTCTYEECSYGQSCQDGAWVAEEEGCAGAGASAGAGP